MANLQFALYLILAGLAGAVISAIRCEAYYVKRFSDNFSRGLDAGIQLERARHSKKAAVLPLKGRIL